jgi:hypothetical protein
MATGLLLSFPIIQKMLKPFYSSQNLSFKNGIKMRSRWLEVLSVHMQPDVVFGPIATKILLLSAAELC